MSPLHQTLTATVLGLLAILLLTTSASHASSSSSSSHPHHENSGRSLASWIRGDSDSTSTTTELHRSKRASIPWEWTIDAIKCSLKIMSVQVSHYHNNELMCCGLWKIKSIIKQSALDVCDKPNNSIAVFNDMIREDLIYSSFSKSLLGDETLDCAGYPEGSPVCDQLWRFIWFIFVLLVLILITVIFGSFVACYCCIYWRNRYQQLVYKAGHKYLEKNYHKAGSESDVSDTSSTNNNKIHKKETPVGRFLKVLGVNNGTNNSRKIRPVATFNPDSSDRLALTNSKNNGPTLRPAGGTQPSMVANGASGQTTPTDRCSSAASTNSSTAPSHKDDPV